MITHKGIIIRVSEGTVTVRIASSQDDCKGCALASMCTQGEEVTLPCPDADASMIGQQVTIGASTGMHRRALMLFMVIPMILVIGILSLCLCIGLSEGTSCIITLAAISIWYAALYIFRVNIRKKASFKLIK